MAIKYFPFNSIVTNGVPDRPANAETLAAYMGAVYKDGVLRKTDTSLQVKAFSGMEIQVLYGAGIIDGKIMVNDSLAFLTVEPADLTLKRIDRVIFRLNTVERLMELVILKGTAGAFPEAPELTQNDLIYEMCLAEISVGAGVTEITSADITDTRDDNGVCGWAHVLNCSTTYEATIGTAWVAEGNYFKQTIQVPGIEPTDSPLVDLVASTSNFEEEQDAYSKIFKITTNSGQITVYASEKTETAVHVQLKVVR